jgi:hypothetical protein
LRATSHGSLRQCLTDIRAKATELRESFGAEAPARALEWAATRLEAALLSETDRVVHLPEAARISGYSEGHLSRLVRKGQVTDMRPPGSRGRIRVRVGDLPTKPGRPHTQPADVRDLASRLGIEARRA